MFKLIVLMFAIVLFSTNTTFAQSDFFWSFNNLNTGATNSDATGRFQTGDTATLYLYYSTINSDLDTGAGLDLSLTNESTIDFTGARTLDFEILVSSTNVPVFDRWVGNNPNAGSVGEASEISDDFVEGLNAVGIIEPGILAAHGAGGIFVDAGYDVGADAFLFASIDFVVTGSAGSVTNINSEVGEIGIVHSGQALDPSFGNATIIVVPEPMSGMINMLGAVGLIARRRR